MVPKVRFELTRPEGHYALNVARLPFRHFGKIPIKFSPSEGIRQLFYLGNDTIIRKLTRIAAAMLEYI